MGRKIVPAFRFMLACLALVALVVQAGMPSGFMPGTGADGTPGIVLCAGFDAINTHGDGNNTPPQPPEQCAYAPALTMGAALPVQLVTVAGRIATTPFLPGPLPARQRASAKTWLAQGPPYA